jgi:hypothetical protein
MYFMKDMAAFMMVLGGLGAGIDLLLSDAQKETITEVLEFKVFAEMQNCNWVQSQWNTMWKHNICVCTHSTLTTIIESAISQFLRTITQPIEHVGYFFRRLVQKMY